MTNFLFVYLITYYPTNFPKDFAFSSFEINFIVNKGRFCLPLLPFLGNHQDCYFFLNSTLELLKGINVIYLSDVNFVFFYFHKYNFTILLYKRQFCLKSKLEKWMSDFKYKNVMPHNNMLFPYVTIFWLFFFEILHTFRCSSFSSTFCMFVVSINYCHIIIL